VDKLTVPTFLTDVENEYLFKPEEHSGKIYELITDYVVSDYIVFPETTHYGIYREGFPKSVKHL